MSAATSVRKTVMIALKDLKEAPYNPKGRTDRNRLGDLMTSMSTRGLIYPIVVSEDLEIIDGHRRSAAAKLLKWTTIEAFIRSEPSTTLFADINSTAIRLSARAMLGVYLADKTAVSGRRLRDFQEAEKFLGRGILEKLNGAGLSLRVYRIAKQIARYTDRTDKAFIKAAVAWLIEFPINDQIGLAMHSGINPEVFITAIVKREPVVFVTRPGHAAAKNGSAK